MAEPKSILNPQITHYVEMIDSLGLGRLKTRYTFTDVEEYQGLLRRNVSEGMRVYWTEMLGRAHLAAVTAILRSRHWLSAVLTASVDKNLLAFAATYRGLMESAADAGTALSRIPLMLAHYHPSISESLSGDATVISGSKEMEDELIHYSHGRYIQKSDKASFPLSHEARPTQKYLQVFESRGSDEIARCYRFLCDLTHPGAPSVYMWLAAMDTKGSVFTISAGQDELGILAFLEEYEGVLLQLLAFAFTAPMLVLRMLNYFSIEELRTPDLSSWYLDNIPLWTKCRSALEAHGVQP